MSEHSHRQTVPRAALWAAFTLILVSMGLAAAARRHNLQVAAQQLVASPSQASVDLRFADQADGGIAVFHATNGRQIHSVPPRSNGFVRGVLRGLFRARKLEAIDRDQSFRLSRESDGRLTLSDPQTGRRVDLGSFGPTNHAAFADILQAAQVGRP